MADTSSIEGAASGGQKSDRPVIGFGIQRAGDQSAGPATSDNTGGQSDTADAPAAQAREAFSKEATDTSAQGAAVGGDKNSSPPAGGERSGLKPGAPDKPVQDIHTQAQSMAKPPESTTQSTAGIDAKQAPIAGSDKSLGVNNQSAKPPDATLIAQSKPDATPPRTAPTESLYKQAENKPVEIKQQEIKQTERTQSENKQTDLPKTGSQSDSGKVQDTSASHMADRPGLKAEPQRNEPIGQTGRQNIESHAPPAQTSKPQENPYQASKAGAEAKQETRAVTAPVPADVSRTQSNPVASPKQNQSDAGPVPERREPVSRASEARTPSSEQSRPVSTDAKPAVQAEQTRRSDEPRSQPTTGELGSGKSTKTDQIAHEQPITKEASETGKHADNRTNPIIEASTVDAKQHAVDHAGGSKDHTANNSHPDEKSILVSDKNKNQQSEPVKDVQPGENKGSKSVASASEPNVSSVGSSDGKQHTNGPALTPSETGKPQSNETGAASDAGKQHSNDAGKTSSESGNHHSSETGKSHSNETGTASDAGKQHLTDAGKASSESGNQHLNETGKPHSTEPGAATEGGKAGKMPSETASDHSNDAGKAPFETGKPNETGLAASDSGKHGDTHNNPIIEATTVEAKTQSSQHIGQTKELGVDTSHADEKGVFLVDKNKEQQLEPGKDAPTSEIRGAKTGSGVTEGNSSDGKRSQDADLTPGTSDKNYIQLGIDQGAVASSRGMLGDGRSDNASDAAVAISDKSGPRAIISLGDLKVDLSSPDMSKKLMDVLTQIQSGKVTAADPISKAFALELLSSKAGVDSILAAHDSKNLELVRQLLSDKLPPDVALDRYKAQWENPQLKTENELLKQKLKERDNVVEVAVREVRKSFSNILRVVVDVFQKKSQELPEPPLGTMLENYMTQTDPIAVIKEEKVRVLSRLTSLGDSILVQSTEKEATEETESSTTVRSQSQDEYGNVRTQYIVKADETYESIALEQFGDECYGQLIESINRSYATTRDDGEYRRHELVEGEILNMPTDKEREEYLDPLLKGAPL